MLPEGLTVCCPNPNCGLRISRVKKTLYHGDIIRAADFDALSDGIEEGGAMNCSKCSAPYFMYGKFHTEQFGWFPPTT